MYNQLKLMSLTALILAAGVSNSNAATEIGKAVEVRQSVKSNGQTIRPGGPIRDNETITTNSNGNGQFRLNDGTRLVVGPGASLKLDAAVTGGSNKSMIGLAVKAGAGALRFITGSLSKDSYEITTPVAVLAIRGTAFDMRTINGKTYIMLISGSVKACSRGRCKTLQSSCSYSVVSRGQVSDPASPRNGNLTAQQLKRAFPFIMNQRGLNRQFRQNVGSCASQIASITASDGGRGSSPGQGNSNSGQGQSGPSGGNTGGPGNGNGNNGNSGNGGGNAGGSGPGTGNGGGNNGQGGGSGNGGGGNGNGGGNSR